MWLRDNAPLVISSADLDRRLDKEQQRVRHLLSMAMARRDPFKSNSQTRKIIRWTDYDIWMVHARQQLAEGDLSGPRVAAAWRERVGAKHAGRRRLVRPAWDVVVAEPQ